MDLQEGKEFPTRKSFTGRSCEGKFLVYKFYFSWTKYLGWRFL